MRLNIVFHLITEECTCSPFVSFSIYVYKNRLTACEAHFNISVNHDWYHDSSCKGGLTCIFVCSPVQLFLHLCNAKNVSFYKRQQMSYSFISTCAVGIKTLFVALIVGMVKTNVTKLTVWEANKPMLQNSPYEKQIVDYAPGLGCLACVDTDPRHRPCLYAVLSACGLCCLSCLTCVLQRAMAPTLPASPPLVSLTTQSATGSPPGRR